jgi:hypothetical protein
MQGAEFKHVSQRGSWIFNPQILRDNLFLLVRENSFET